MSKGKAISRPYEQTAQQRAELDALRRMLVLSEGTFSLSVAICNSPALRDHIVKHIAGEVQGIEVVRIPEDAHDILDTVRRQIPNAQARAVFVVDMEKALAEDKRNRVLQNLNVSREQWQATYRCPVVFWLPEYVISLLTTQARDLWSWVSHQFEFVSEQATPLAGLQETFAGDLGLAGNLDVHAKRFRIAELEQRIAEVGESLQGQMREHVPIWLSELAYIYYSLGEMGKAQGVFRRVLEISEKLGLFESMASAYGNLGVIYRSLGNVADAETVLNKALAIDKRLGRLEGMAADYGNLSNIHQTRGDLDKAESMLRKSIAVEEKLNRPEEMATAYGNLGLIYQKRGDFDRAEEIQNRALEMERKLGRREGIANQYGNLGVTYSEQGRFDEAEKMLIKALELNQELGRAQAIADVYGNLGLLYRKRDQLEEAEAMYRKALAIYEAVDALVGIASTYGNLGAVHQSRGDLNEAERMYRKSLEINERLGRLTGTAHQYGNLGLICEMRGNYAQAQEYGEKALVLFQRMGAKDKIARVRSWLDSLPKDTP